MYVYVRVCVCARVSVTVRVWSTFLVVYHARVVTKGSIFQPVICGVAAHQWKNFYFDSEKKNSVSVAKISEKIRSVSMRGGEKPSSSLEVSFCSPPPTLLSSVWLLNVWSLSVLDGKIFTA